MIREKLLFRSIVMEKMIGHQEGTAMNEASDVYTPENLMRYHTALAFVDHLEATGFLDGAEKAKVSALIASRYGIKIDSIYFA